MPEFDVACFTRQDEDVVVVFVGRGFGQQSEAQRRGLWVTLRQCASEAGLTGTIVPVWEAPDGGMSFLAPKPWHPFFKSVTLEELTTRVNGKLTCG